MDSKDHLSRTALKRLAIEEATLKQEGKENGFSACPRTTNAYKDYKHWDVYIKGSEDTLYEGTVLHAVLEFPYEYPIYPPKMKFISRMFHPNIYSDGKVCISILHTAGDDPTSYEKPDEKWTPVQSVRTIVLSVVSLLNEPNIVSPANVDASKKFKEDLDGYKKIVRELALAESKKDIHLN